MDLQSIFDTVATHLSTQKCRAINSKGTCAYRGQDNTKCAFGILIPDEDYHESMEGYQASTLILEGIEKVPPLKNKYPWMETFLIQDLQNAHDHAAGYIFLDLNRIAKDYKLNTDVLDTLSFPENWI